ncbi:MAG: alpha/beta hydrolase [Clostridia bacterium]|nr:alpha/beta hydrolase [Clostridia bacterium]
MRYVEKVYKEGVTLKGYLYEANDEMPYFNKRPAVVVCPGGGYLFCSAREADPVATVFSAAGFNTFICTYTVGENAAFPSSLVDLSIAVKDIRENADDWGIDADKIAVCGFSAGGHLCASLGTLWNLPEVQEKSGCMNGENKPNALVLGYPVINTYSWMEPHVVRLAGDRDFNETVNLLNTDKNVGPHTPPAFIMHTYCDDVVAVEDSLNFANAMAANDRPFELHIFTNGVHGISVGDMRVGSNEPEASKWCDMACDWLWKLFGRDDKAALKFGENRKHPEK